MPSTNVKNAITGNREQIRELLEKGSIWKVDHIFSGKKRK